MIYAYAGISNSEHKIKSLDKELDTEKDKGHDLYKQVTALKSSYPDLNILLGVGGFEDQNNKEKYLELVSPLGAPYAATATGPTLLLLTQSVCFLILVGFTKVGIYYLLFQSKLKLRRSQVNDKIKFF